jgi:hypothetical protein
MKSSKQQPLDLSKGLFLIRYEAADDPGRPPKITLSAGPSRNADLQFILPPGVTDPVMWSPGASIVARAEGNSQLIVEVSSNGSLGAKIQAIPLLTDPSGLSAEEIDQVPDISGIKVLGHLSGRGDTVVPAGEWLGGPMSPSRIEGIGIDWANKPRQFNLNYSVRVGGGNASTATELSEVGTFSGTRGRALPLVGATFEVSGASSEGFHIVADAIFLGSPQMRVMGRRVVLSGPSGREPLVGLRLQISAIEAPALVRSPTVLESAPAPSTAPQNLVSKSGTSRVRVFRSKGASSKA